MMQEIVQLVGISMVFPNPKQARKIFTPQGIEDLAQSIKKHGLLQPIVVIEKDVEHFMIVAGERRFRACKAAGMDTIMCKVLKNISDEKIAELCLIENIQREGLNPIEEAEGYEQLIKLGHTQMQIAEKIGKSRAHVSNTMRLLKLPLFVRKYMLDGVLSHGHGMSLLGMPAIDPEIVLQVVQEKLSVSSLRKMLRSYEQQGADGDLKEEDKQEDHETLSASDAIEISKQLEQYTGFKVVIEPSKKSVSFKYQDLNQLDALLEKLMKK